MFAILFILFSIIEAQTKVVANETNLPSSNYLLPLIMIEYKGKFYPPTHIEKDIKIKKHPSALLGDTDFKKENYPGEPIYFCPAKPKYQKRIQYENEHGSRVNENCLFEKTFRKSKELKCSKIASPILIKYENEGCGQGQDGTIYEFAYQLCISMSEKEKQRLTLGTLFTRHKKLPCREFTYHQLYKLCYNHDLSTTIYTEHQVISPTLFAYDEMNYDHIKIFDMMTDGFGYLDSDIFKKQNDAYTEEFERPQHAMKQIPQKLVPSEHLFFALWKQPTYHYVNVKPQNEQLFGLWRQITNSILRSARTMIAHTHLIYTGAFKLPKVKKQIFTVGNKIIIPDIWICLIFQFPKQGASSTPAKGVAFMMSNYIDRKDIAKEMNKYCTVNSCEKYLDQTFTLIGGFIRCCPAIAKIQEFFGFEIPIPRVLYLRELNYEDELDFAKFDFDNPIP